MMTIDLENISYEQACELLNAVRTRIANMESFSSPSIPGGCQTSMGFQENQCIHQGTKEMVELLTECEIVMMINTFNHLSKCVYERLKLETQQNEKSFLGLREKQSLIDNMIKKLEV